MTHNEGTEDKMGTSTRVESVKAANKQHRCDWCPEKIEAGESYERYRYFGDDGPAVIKMHPECYDAMLEVAREEGPHFEFTMHESPRGCSCGGCGDCSYCQTHNAALRGAGPVE